MRSYVEMTAPAELVASPDVPGLRLAPASDAAELGDVARRVGAPYAWPTATATREEWERRLADPLLRHWFVEVDGAVAGLVAIRSHAGGEVEIDTFGLLPEFVGRGYGGAALTAAVRQAWATPAADGLPPRRVWLHTSTEDHPNALRNYRRRGFRVVRTEAAEPR